MEKNLYEELGLKKNATRSEIKSSYRSLVKKHHPDTGGNKERYEDLIWLLVALFLRPNSSYKFFPIFINYLLKITIFSGLN